MAHAQPAPRRPSSAEADRRHDLVVIGASAGGVEALLALVRDLPGDLRAPVLVVLHVLSSGTSLLPQLLDRAGPLPAEAATDGQELAPGRIYVAPPDHHVVVQPGRLELSRGPRENGHRPAVDVLFRSAAWAYGSRVVGVILSGARDDGTSGLRHVKSLGGLAIVQDPQEALYPGMPRSAAKSVAVDWIAPLKGIAPLLTRLVREGHPAPASMGGSAEPVAARLDDPSGDGDDATGLTCPDCGGALWQVNEGSLVRLQCRVGHTFSPETLLSSQADSLESALWAALRTLEERGELLARMSARARQHRDDSSSADRFQIQARDAQARAGLIREAIMQAPEGDEAAVSEPEEVATKPSGNGAGST